MALSVLPGPWFPKLYSRQDKLIFTYTLVRSCSPQACCLSPSDPKLLLKVPLAACICASLPTLHPRPGHRLPLPLCVSSWVSCWPLGAPWEPGAHVSPPQHPASDPMPAPTPRANKKRGKEGGGGSWLDPTSPPAGNHSRHPLHSCKKP